MALTRLQQDFCRNISIYDMKPADAYYAAGYPHEKRLSDLNKKVHMLLSNKAVSDEIDRLRTKCFDIDEVRRDLILEHEQTRDMDITSIMEPVEYIDDNGVYQTRLSVKPVSEWSPALRKACIGFDRYGVPKFRDKADATKELSRLYGLYKDNTVVVQQDLNGVIADALGESSDSVEDDGIILSAEYDNRNSEELEELDNKLFEMSNSSDCKNNEDILGSML